MQTIINPGCTEDLRTNPGRDKLLCVFQSENQTGSCMSTTADESKVYAHLRGRAEAHLLAGTAPTTGHGVMGVDALRLLHRLSSNPDSAQDALKLLHELQVHQVELDMQIEQIAADERMMTEDLGLYQTLYLSAPFGYLVVDPEGVVTQSNAAAADIFGVGCRVLTGQRIDTFLDSSHRPGLRDMMQDVLQSGSRGSCVAEIIDSTQHHRRLQFLASREPVTGHILLACCEYGSEE